MNDRSIIGTLVNITTGDIACRHLPLLLSLPEWSEQDLKAISDCLSDSEFLDQLYQTLCRTRAAGVYYFNALINGDQWAIDQVAEMGKHREWPQSKLLRAELISALPRGWLYQNMNNLTTRGLSINLQHYDFESKRIVETQAPKPPTARDLSPYNFLSSSPDPDLWKVFKKSAIVQSQWDLCRLLCALERHRRVHGELPEKLEALVPEFLTELPHDYVTGLPPHYRIGAGGEAELATLDWEKTGNPETFLCRVPSSE